MVNQPQGPNSTSADQPAPTQNVARPRRSRLGLVWDIAFEYFSLSNLGDHLKNDELPNLKHVPFVLIFIVSLCFATGYFVGGCKPRSARVALVSALATTNAFFAGALAEKSQVVQRLEAQIAKTKQEHNDEVFKLRLDSSEARRQAEAENLKLITERNSAQQRLSLFETMPAQVFSLYSNLADAYSYEPTNRAQVLSLFSRVETFATNLLSVMERAPAFEIYLADLKIRDDEYIVIPVETNNCELIFTLKNTGNWPALHPTLVLGIPREFQVVSSAGWEKTHAVLAGESIVRTDAVGYKLRAEKPLADGELMGFEPITVQTTKLILQHNSIRIDVAADNAPKVRRTLWLMFKNGNGKPHLGLDR